MNAMTHLVSALAAYAIEYDLRVLMYRHLTRMSFGFYDRVQSGQLISRANSDIRSVQMYLAFAPSIILQCGVAVVAFAYMASIDLPLALVALSPMPFVVIAGIEMRQRIFPVSWLWQARLADEVGGERVDGGNRVTDRAGQPVAGRNVVDLDVVCRGGRRLRNLHALADGCRFASSARPMTLRWSAVSS